MSNLSGMSLTWSYFASSNGVRRLVEFAPVYFDLATFPDGEAKRALQRISAKKAGKFGRVEDDAGPAKKKQKKRAVG